MDAGTDVGTDAEADGGADAEADGGVDAGADSGTGRGMAEVVEDWGVAVGFCTLYGLALPVRLLQDCARKDQWQLFVIFIQRYDYPPQSFLPILKVFISPSSIQVVFR